LDAVWLAAGERYDILVKTKADTKSHPSAYKINVFHTNPEFCSIAWLKYPGQNIDPAFEPDCKSMTEEHLKNSVLNPVPNNFTAWNSPNIIFPKDLRAKAQAKNIGLILNTHYVSMTCETRCNFNNYQMLFPAAETADSVASSGYPNVPFLFQSPSNQAGRCGAVCNKTMCRNQGPLTNPLEPAICSHVLQLPKALGEWFEIVLINTNPNGRMAHPIHQHGGWYNIIGQGQFDQDISRELIIEMDTNCTRGSKCLPRNLDRPIFKDTIQVPTSGYVIFRTPLDNPGNWIVHCHINNHIERGMAMVFQFGEPSEWAMGSNSRVALGNKNKMCFN